MRYVIGISTMVSAVVLSWLDVDDRVGIALFVVSAIAVTILGIRQK